MSVKYTQQAKEILALREQDEDPDDYPEHEEFLADITDSDGFWYSATLGGGLQPMLDLVFEKECHAEFWEAVKVVRKFEEAFEAVAPEV